MIASVEKRAVSPVCLECGGEGTDLEVTAGKFIGARLCCGNTFGWDVEWQKVNAPGDKTSEEDQNIIKELNEMPDPSIAKPGDLLVAVVDCRECKLETELGTEEVPHPIDQRVHTCFTSRPHKASQPSDGDDEWERREYKLVQRISRSMRLLLLEFEDRARQ